MRIPPATGFGIIENRAPNFPNTASASAISAAYSITCRLPTCSEQNRCYAIGAAPTPKLCQCGGCDCWTHARYGERSDVLRVRGRRVAAAERSSERRAQAVEHHAAVHGVGRRRRRAAHARRCVEVAHGVDDVEHHHHAHTRRQRRRERRPAPLDCTTHDITLEKYSDIQEIR